MGNSVVVHLIRHEKTKANWQRKYLGWTDEPIAIRKAVCSVPVHTETVYGSDLKRCRETAELYFPNARYLPFSGLRELDFGDFEMKTYEELKHFETYRRWIDAPYKVTPPDGESFVDFEKRVLDTFHHIVGSGGEYVFVVHGGVIRLLISKFLKEHSFQEVTAEHRTIYTFVWNDVGSLKGGEACNRLSVAPITVRENL